MLDLRRADAVGERPEGAMGRRVAVAADDGCARQGETLFGADDMNHALAPVMLVVIFDAEIAGVDRQLLDLRPAFRVLDRLGAVGGRHVVIHHRQRLLRRMDLAMGEAQALEGLGAGHLMDEMAVDIDQGRAVGLDIDDMIVPDLVIKGARLFRGFGRGLQP